MKKILSLFSLLMLCIVGANAETVKYALTEGDTFTSGQTVEVKNGDAVVATITYGESGGADFAAASANSSVEGYTAFTAGNGTNGNKTGGTFYTITLKVDAKIAVAVVLNASKSFYIEEDGTALEAYNGIQVDSKYYGTYEFDATADKAYKVYCAGSKLGFYGFEMTYSSEAPTNETYTIGANVNGMGANMDLTLAEGATLPYTATFADCYRAAMGSEPAAMIQIQNAVVTSGTNVTIGTLNGWDTTFTISEEGTSVISLTTTIGAMTITVNVAKYIPAETKTFTLVPGPWDVDGARYAAWTWSNEEDGQWIDFTKVGETYTISIPAANTGLILARMNGETTENNWNEGTLWNKTGDIDITNVPDNSVFTITGWGESDYTISAAATPLEAAKAALQAAIDKVKAYNTTGLAEVIAAAEAAIADENATIESIQAAAAAFEAGVKAYLKEVLAKAIPMLESLNAETLADAITAAKAALANENATAAELADALFGMIEPARPYIVGILQQTVDVCKPLGIDTSAAEAALSQGDAASTVGLALTLYNLTQTAIPAVQEVVKNLKAYMAVFSSDAATALAEDFAKLEADVSSGDIAAVKNDIEALMVKGKTYLEADIVKLEGYAAILNNEAITADVAAMKAALEAGSFAGLLAAVEQFKTDFLAAAPGFVQQIKFAAAGYKDAGKTVGMEQLEAAIAAAEEALGKEDKTIVTVGLAVRNLIVALQTYVEANSTYTIAGTQDLTATEEAWQVVEANNMTFDAESGLYTWTAENITVNAENQPQFKVVITNIDDKQTWIPASEEGDDHNWVITPNVVGGEGVYNITITFNAKTQEIGVTGEIVTANIATFNFADPNFRENIGESMTDTKGYIYNETFTAEGVSLQITAGSAPSRIYVDNNRGQCLVTYKEYTTLTFCAPEGKAITKIEFTAAGNSNIKNFTASSGEIVEMTWTGNAAGVRFLQGSTSYLANAIVTLDDAGEATAALPAIEYTECANIAAFNALEAGTYAKITLADAEVIGKSADGYSTVWVQDATGGAWIQYTSLNDRLQEGTKVNGTVFTIKRFTSGNPQLKEAEATINSEIASEAISSYTIVEGTIEEVNVAENLNKVVKISGATLAMTSASAGKLTLGESTIDVNNGTETANQQLHKIADWEKDKVLENITITAILVAKSATANQLLPISIELEHTYTVAGAYKVGEEEQALFFGEKWNPALDANVMTKQEDGTYAITFENVTFEQPGTILYKVCEDKAWDVNYGFDGNNADYIINEACTAEKVTFTFNPNAEGYKVSCTVKFPDSELMKEAKELAADADAVAVGKLLAAIEVAEAGDESGLQAAIDQYKLDNADQEKDETAKVATNGWKKFDGTNAGVCATQFAPAITTYDGRTAQMAECYETNGNRTGTIIYQDITGLTNGKYKVGFYGNAFSTSQRDGFECTMEDGATDVAYVFANEEKEYISARIATSTTENDFRQFDVEVTDGNIKLGMGKDTEKSTNWHTIQIYQLTWFTTAKEVYALDQTELAALITEAKALAADESKTNGKDALNAAIATAEEATTAKVNWYNIPEVEAIIAGLKEAIADFKKANWYIDLTAGEYYIIDVESGLKMAAGHDWGTRGIVNELGLDLTLTPYTESRTVTIDSRVNNNGSHFLGENLYMDSSEWGWALEYQGFGFYILEPNGGKYINLDKDNNLVLSNTPREFIIVTKDGVRAQLLEELSVATKDAPVDATGLITANNFNRFDTRNTEAWIVSVDCTNSNLSGGNNVNNCAESYHSTFTIMQTISDAPAGFYQLTAQGFYRQDNYEGELPAAPVFFANEVNGDVPAKTGSENGMSDASASFTNGLYTIEPINFEVKDDGMMYIGITASTNTQWVIWDNFQLKYFGTENPTTGISNVVVETANNGAVYNLNGQKVMKAQKGLYIINGKKVVLK